MAVWVRFGTMRCGILTVAASTHGITGHGTGEAQNLCLCSLAAPWPQNSTIAADPRLPATELSLTTTIEATTSRVGSQVGVQLLCGVEDSMDASMLLIRSGRDQIVARDDQPSSDWNGGVGAYPLHTDLVVAAEELDLGCYVPTLGTHDTSATTA